MSTQSLIFMVGSFLLVMMAVGGWLFRTSSAPFFVKIIIPITLLILTCATPYQLPSILGWPVEMAYASLPSQAELIAFVAHDDEKKVVLWLREGSNEPRSYEIELTDELKSTLRKAKETLAAGQRAELVKKGKPGKTRPPGYIDIDGGAAPYVLDPSAFALPSKGDGQ